MRLTAAIRDEVRRDVRGVRRRGRGARVAASAALALIVGTSFAVLTRGDGVHSLTDGALYGAFGWALVVLGILLAGLGRFGAHTRMLQIAIAAGVPLSFLVYLTTLHTSLVPLSAFLSERVHTSSALSCGQVGLSFGAFASVGVLFVWRRTDPFNPTWSGAIAGLVGGIAGAMSVGLVCPHREGWHLWLGHGLVVLALSWLGAGLGRRVLAP
jgi:hypothetical protein